MGRVVDGRGAVVRRVLSSVRLRGVLLAYLVFNVHEWAVYIAVLVWAYGEGGVRAASLVGLLQLVPSAVLASPLSVLLLRMRRSTALVVGYAVQGAAMLALAAALLAEAPFAVVSAAAAAAAVAVTLTRPAHLSLLPEVSETVEDLTAGNAASGFVEAVATLLGPLTSAALLGLFAPGAVPLVLGALTLLSAVALLLVLRSTDGAASPLAFRASGAWRLVLRDPASRLLCGLVTAEYVLIGLMDILLVVLALDVLGMADSGPGILNSAIGIGGLLGAALTVVLVGGRRLASAVLLGAVVAGVSFGLAGLATGVLVAVVLVAGSGAGKSFFDVANRTLVQRLLPDRLLGAVFGLQEGMMMAGLAVGTLLAPLLVELAGDRVALLLAGAVLPVVALLCGRGLRRLDRATEVPAHVLELLRGVPLLAVLAPRVVERLALESAPVHVAAGEDVVTEGEPGDRFYVIEGGRAAVTIAGQAVRVLEPGAWFGELALLHDGPRTATVTALDDLLLHAVDRDSFLASVGLSAPSRELAEGHARDHYR